MWFRVEKTAHIIAGLTRYRDSQNEPQTEQIAKSRRVPILRYIAKKILTLSQKQNIYTMKTSVPIMKLLKE